MGTDRSFTRDSRAVAPIIGAVLLFGLFTVAFAGYQATAVPQQNAETEFQHYEAVQNDLIVVRNAISRAGQQNQSQFESVQLGTRYRERVLALNPPAPAGTLRTSDPYDVTIEQGGTPIAASPIPTRFLTYQSGYNELDVAPIRYDNSVLYLSDPDGGEAVVFEEQNLVRDDGDVVLTALQNSFSRSATGRVTVELYPTDAAPATLPDGTLTLTIPTQLSAGYWTDALAETALDETDYEVLDASEAYPEASDVRGLELQVTADDLVFNTVGIDSAPDGANSPTTGVGGSDGDDTDDGDTVTGFPLKFDSPEKVKGGALDFTASNQAGESVTVTSFSADASSIEKNARINDGTSPEVEITPDSGSSGELNQDGEGSNGRIDADGQVYPLDETAVINDGSDVTIYTSGWEENNGDTLKFELEHVDSEAEADVIVTLGYESFETQSFYFRDTS
jgi:hypothetical protein